MANISITSEMEEGCVRYVPGTQHERQPIGELSARHGWDIPGSIDVPTQAGETLLPVLTRYEKDGRQCHVLSTSRASPRATSEGRETPREHLISAEPGSGP